MNNTAEVRPPALLVTWISIREVAKEAWSLKVDTWALGLKFYKINKEMPFNFPGRLMGA